VICDHTSGYKGKFGVTSSLILSQKTLKEVLKPDLIIEIGNITGDYFVSKIYDGVDVWRVDHLNSVIKSVEIIKCYFRMTINQFFDNYIQDSEYLGNDSNLYYNQWTNEYNRLYGKIEDLPLSNLWVAKQLHDKLPSDSNIHFGILNSLRSWNFFEVDKKIETIANVGGFGIDGNLSTIIGAAISKPHELFYAIVGDLAFFYDMNSLGNREITNNIRIILINNGTGTEFKNFNHLGSEFDSKRLDKFVAAKGHFGNKSSLLVKNYAENLGFSYYAVNDKNELIDIERILTSDLKDNGLLIVEVFVNEKDESDALELIINLDLTPEEILVSKIKKRVVKTVGNKNAKRIKKLFGR
jgi:2-succinyl-5-enolpyruvyl-6-hydroxy-3-cyclohexene-1-carboxylate synthase